MKIKIIDLLNKIANGEKVPKKIQWEDIIYAYSEYDKDYLEYPFSDEEYKGLFDMRNNILTRFLNDEVEIIEEDEKIEYPILHKTAPNETTGDEMPNWRYLIDKNFECLNKTIYKLADEINNLKEK